MNGARMQEEVGATVGARAVDWSHERFVEVRPGIVGATVHTPQLTVTLYRYRGGSTWEEHQHPQDQVTIVIAGTIDFVVDGRKLTLSEGELATIPGGSRHGATVPDGEGASALNVFTRREAPPPSP